MTFFGKILFYLSIEKKYFLKLFLGIFLVFWISWNYLGVRNFTYKHLYGKPISQTLKIWDKEVISDYDGALEPDNFNGYPVLRSFKKKYAVSGMLVYHDDNTTFWKKHFWNLSGKTGEVYNQVASHDLTIFWGKTAHPSNLKNIKVTHELNGAGYSFEGDTYYSEGESNNFHIIPANKRLDEALSILPESKKVPIYVEGYLTYWYGTGDYSSLKMESAFNAYTVSPQKVGGGRTGLCYQLYLTRFIYDGYVFE